MYTQRCPFCDTRIYCTEMMCDCAQTKRIPVGSKLSDHYEAIAKPPKQRKGNYWGRMERQQVPDLAQGPYSGRNPHPFADSTGELWDVFWENVGYIGKSHFYGNRNEYSAAYWSDIDPRDVWTVMKRSKFDNNNGVNLFNKDQHYTWKE